ncbi:uncharacterized protein LOC111321030 isoform X2 [Stylophora pistillata]|uniref:uncharacterized protein LOC111321030 isoform X2 n=1 Tax=Stylophora pistillata TaxID=50429 RepID=UPI000C054780|nr:uncharacterized protein LOC111321030 isoform X2 [Stylophora pistillata]
MIPVSHSEVPSFGLDSENMIQLDRAVCKTMSPLMKYLVAKSLEEVGYQARREEIPEKWRHLKWEDYRQGREAFTRKNLINLAQHLWEYLLLNNSTRVRTFSSMYNDRGWTQYSMQHVTTFEQRVQMLLQFIKVFTSKSKPRATQLTRFTNMDLEEFGILPQHTESL